MVSGLMLQFGMQACSSPRDAQAAEATDNISHAHHAAATAPAPANDSPRAGATTESISVFDLDGKFVDQNGHSVTLKSVARPVNVVAFIYTSCKETCPLIVGALKRIEAGLSATDRDSVRFVLISIDPDRDTPGRMSEWAKTAALDESNWTLLVGDDAAIRELAVSLDIRYQTMANGEIAHTNGFTLLDDQGRVMHYQAGFTDIDESLKIIQARR